MSYIQRMEAVGWAGRLMDSILPEALSLVELALENVSCLRGMNGPLPFSQAPSLTTLHLSQFGLFDPTAEVLDLHDWLFESRSLGRIGSIRRVVIYGWSDNLWLSEFVEDGVVFVLRTSAEACASRSALYILVDLAREMNILLEFEERNGDFQRRWSSIEGERIE